MERIKGSRHNTLVNIVNEYMGSQWALFNARVVLKGVYKGPLVHGFNRTTQQHP